MKNNNLKRFYDLIFNITLNKKRTIMNCFIYSLYFVYYFVYETIYSITT